MKKLVGLIGGYTQQKILTCLKCELCRIAHPVGFPQIGVLNRKLYGHPFCCIVAAGHLPLF